MKIIVVLGLLLAIQMPSAAQDNTQDAILFFYTLAAPGPGGPLGIYRDDQKIGEVSKEESLRLVLSPGSYQFALRENAPESERLSLSPRAGQQLFIRLAREGFFLGNAPEAVANARTIGSESVSANAKVELPTPQPVQEKPEAQVNVPRNNPSVPTAPNTSDARAKTAPQAASSAQPKNRTTPTPSKTGDKVPENNKTGNPRAATSPTQKSGDATPIAVVPDTAAPGPTDDFIIGAEDVLEIRVWREPDLTTRSTVRPDGKIGVTLLGDVQASGLTATQLKQVITEKLSRYVEGPEVSVVVVEVHSRMVHLIGFVGRPGAYSLGGPMTVVELLARAGGLTEFAKPEEIAIVRNNGGGKIERILFNYKAFTEGRNLQRNIPLKNGDVVVVR